MQHPLWKKILTVGTCGILFVILTTAGISILMRGYRESSPTPVFQVQDIVELRVGHIQGYIVTREYKNGWIYGVRFLGNPWQITKAHERELQEAKTAVEITRLLEK